MSSGIDLNKIKGWIFDLDGVLVLSEPVHLQSWQEVFRRHGMTLGDEWFAIGVGMSDMQFYSAVAPEFKLDPSSTVFLNEKREIFQQMIQNGLPLVDGIQDLLATLAPHFRLGVATSSGRRYVDFLMHLMGWDKIFSTIMTRNEVQRTKPDPEIYLKAARHLGLSPQECMAVEDSPTGLSAAIAAELKTIAITTTFRRDDLAAADWIVDSYKTVKQVVEQA